MFHDFKGPVSNVEFLFFIFAGWRNSQTYLVSFSMKKVISQIYFIDFYPPTHTHTHTHNSCNKKLQIKTRRRRKWIAHICCIIVILSIKIYRSLHTIPHRTLLRNLFSFPLHYNIIIASSFTWGCRCNYYYYYGWKSSQKGIKEMRE